MESSTEGQKRIVRVRSGDSRFKMAPNFLILFPMTETSKQFNTRMDEFDSIDGVHPDKFYALGAYVYSSVAMCIDRFLTYSAAGLADQDRSVIERISSRLKRLASNLPDPKALFPEYWVHGREIANDLAAHVYAHGKMGGEALKLNWQRSAFATVDFWGRSSPGRWTAICPIDQRTVKEKPEIRKSANDAKQVRARRRWSQSG